MQQMEYPGMWWAILIQSDTLTTPFLSLSLSQSISVQLYWYVVSFLFDVGLVLIWQKRISSLFPYFHPLFSGSLHAKILSRYICHTSLTELTCLSEL